MPGVDGASERLRFLADVVTREALTLSQTDSRLFSAAFGLAQVASLSGNPDLAERVDVVVAKFSRLQDTLGAALLPRLLEAFLEPVGTVLDNLNRAERLGWVRSASDWAELRLLRNRMVHEYVREPQDLVDALNAAHECVADLVNTAQLMSTCVRSLVLAVWARLPRPCCSPMDERLSARPSPPQGHPRCC